MNYKKKVISGIGWLSFLRLTSQASTMVKLIIISRILTPADFGLYAIIATTLTTFDTLSDTGLNYAVIHMQAEIEEIARSLFVINIVRGVMLSLAVAVTSYFVASFFNYSSLVLLLIAASVVPLIKGFTNPYVINFQKEMNFDKEFLYRFLPTLFNALITIIFVLAFRSVWALIIGLIGSTLIEVITSYIIADRNLRKPISKAHMLRLFSYGKWITSGGLVSYLGTQLDNIFIGRLLGPASLGLYDISFRISNLAFNEVTNLVSQVMFPLFSKKQKAKKSLYILFKRNVLSMFIISLFFAAPILLFPKQILLTFFGEKWLGSANSLQVLAVYGVMRATIGPIGPLLLSLGKPEVLTKINLINFVILIFILYPLIKSYGITGAALAMTISYALILPIYIHKAKKVFEI